MDDPASDVVISRLSLDRARASDTGNFTCRLLNLPRERRRRPGLSDTVAVHVMPKAENSEAIYSGENKVAALAEPLVLLLLLIGAIVTQ